MNTRPSANTMPIPAAAIDSFMVFAAIYLTTAGRLTASILSTARSALEDCAAAKTAAISTGRAMTALLPLSLSQSMTERALTYSRDTYEIVTRAQVEAAHLLIQQVASGAFDRPDIRVALPTHWTGAFNLFAQGEHNLAAMLAAPAARKAA